MVQIEYYEFDYRHQERVDGSCWKEEKDWDTKANAGWLGRAKTQSQRR